MAKTTSQPTRIVTAVGLSVNSERLAGNDRQRIETAMQAAILACLDEGISTDEAHAPIIKARMQAAYDRTLAEIEAERGQ